jgi:hypothetical protein
MPANTDDAPIYGSKKKNPSPKFVALKSSQSWGILKQKKSCCKRKVNVAWADATDAQGQSPEETSNQI